VLAVAEAGALMRVGALILSLPVRFWRSDTPFLSSMLPYLALCSHAPSSSLVALRSL
jgi:hypothetical protein